MSLLTNPNLINLIQYVHTYGPHWIGGGLGYGALSYAVRTFPIPNNEYLKWFICSIQYLFANLDKGHETLKSTRIWQNHQARKMIRASFKKALDNINNVH